MPYRNTDKGSTTTKSFRSLDEMTPDRPENFVKDHITDPIDNFVSLFRNRYNDSYASGIFELPLPEQYSIAGEGNPDEFNKSIQFLQRTLQMYDFANAFSPKWIVFIEPHNHQYLLASINHIDLHVPAGKLWKVSPESTKILTGHEAQRKIGCIFAIGVGQVGETTETTTIGGIDGVINGFNQGEIVNGRTSSNILDLTVRETNTSYTDLILRPWTILTSKKGLVARPQYESLKATITVLQMAHTDAHKRSSIRKIFNYYNCAPINIGSEVLSYESATLTQRQIQFAFSHYSVGDMTTYNDDPPTEYPQPTYSSKDQIPQPQVDYNGK